MDYGYNKVHDRTYERFGSSGSSGDGFAYDKLRRLTNAWTGSATPSNPTSAQYTKKIDYNYDDDGNRTSVVVTPWQQSAGTTSYTTNGLYQYTNVGGTTHVWDSNGNLTDDGTLLFEYNYKNLPVYVRLKSNNNLVVTYKYDALGRRVEKDHGSNNAERYVYSGLETIATYNAFDTWRQDFVYAQGIDRIVMLEQPDVLDYDSDQDTSESTRSYYHRNALGSVMEITDANEAAVVSYRYDPYGTVTITRGGQTQSTDPLGQHWTFTSRFFDEESGLYQYRARCYDSALGRFAQRDPLGVREGPNLYAYAGSSPAVFGDPLGTAKAHPRAHGYDPWFDPGFDEEGFPIPVKPACSCCCEAVDLEFDTNESYGVGQVMSGIGLFVTPLVVSKKKPGGSCTLKWEEYPVGLGYGTEGGPPVVGGQWNDLTDHPAFAGSEELKSEGKVGAGERALEDLRDPSNEDIFPIVDTPHGGNGREIYIRVTLESGCPGGKTVITVIKFWMDGDGAHAEELSGNNPEIPR